MTGRRDDNAIRGLVFAIGISLLVTLAALVVAGLLIGTGTVAR
ncbi:hypothetical protein NXT08_22330 [Rhodococcus pyridinivorans]|nr:hypothetical protein [Rhodococcus pyridinivorans]UVT24941.1 hypothetical protein NXT08_22330 [Rhodococcus pyridinivorans]